MFWNTNDGIYNGFARGSDGNFDHSKSYVSSTRLCADHQVCMNVGINPKGAEQIKNYFNEDRLELQFQTKTTGLRKVLSRYFNTSLSIGQIPQSAYNETFKNCQTTALILIGDGEFKDSSGLFSDTKDLINKLISELQQIQKISDEKIMLGYLSDTVDWRRALAEKFGERDLA